MYNSANIGNVIVHNSANIGNVIVYKDGSISCQILCCLEEGCRTGEDPKYSEITFCSEVLIRACFPDNNKP